MSNDKKSIHTILEDGPNRADPEDFVSDVEDAATRVSELDDNIRELIKDADDFKDEFDNKTIKDLREYCEMIAKALEEIQTDLY